MAAFLGPGNALGVPIPLAEAESHLFGLVLLNDWSARDMQKWEYQPLGPFLAKSFATSISPWVVTLEALAPFRVPAFARPEGDPQPLPYLAHPEDRAHGGIDLQLEVRLVTKAMRERGLPPHQVSLSNLRDVYWTFAQMVAHHSSQRLQPAARRPDRERHRLGPREGEPRLPDRAHLARHGAAGAAGRRGAALPRGRRRGDPARPLRARGLRSDRLRRVPRRGSVSFRRRR